MTDRSFEQEWIEWLAGLDPIPLKAALRFFCGQYLYFSMRQVIAFTGVFRTLGPLDRESLTMLGDVLHEELGRGSLERVHSILFERFALSAGVEPSNLQIPESEITAGVRGYVEELSDAFFSGDVARTLAAYDFLESSAVKTYGPLTELFRGFGFSEQAIEFFALHAEVEQDHADSARRMVERQKFGKEEQDLFEYQQVRMANLWAGFWRDIFAGCRNSVEGRKES